MVVKDARVRSFQCSAIRGVKNHRFAECKSRPDLDMGSQPPGNNTTSTSASRTPASSAAVISE
jgi:hypothetical protein